MKATHKASAKAIRKIMRELSLLNVEQSRLAFYLLVKTVIQLLMEGREVVLPGLGRFYWRYRSGRMSNTLNGQKVFVPGHYIVKFHIAPRLRLKAREVIPLKERKP